MRNQILLTATVIITSLLIFTSCGSNQEDAKVTDSGLSLEIRLERISDAENRVMNIIQNNPTSADYLPTVRSLIEEYRQFVHFFPDHPESPEMLFRAGNLQADAVNDFEIAIGTFNRIIREYPESDQARRSQFLIGYTYSEHLEDFESARSAYERFLEKYPDDELAEAVETELRFMGKSLEEIMQELGLE